MATKKKPTTPARKKPAAAKPKAAPKPKKPKKITFPALVKLGREILGIEELRPGQAEGLKHVLAGRNVLAVMPTGSGKSLLYQLPSLALPGLTIVVSPLIALIKDQVDKMRERGVTALRIDSTLTVRQKREMMALANAPGGKLLLTTPERMADPEFRKTMTQAAGAVGVSLFVVDEAHCVSQWGHDFRPAYLVLRQAVEELGKPPVLATTATAPPHVRDDILFQLGIPNAKIVTTSFDRPNLHFEVIASPGEDEKKKVLIALVKKLARPGIVYCATVRAVEQLGEELARHGVPVATYHGRMQKAERDEMQGLFMDKRSKLLMVATNAFGLGVDKADIRYVFHYHVPGSLEQYAQEAGRSGRDGKPARCVLLFSPDDVAIQEHFLKGTYPTQRQVMAVIDGLSAWGGEGRPPTLKELAMSSHVGATRTRTVLALLKDEGWVVEERGGRFHLAEPPPERERVRERAKEYEKRRIADRRRLDALLEYVRVEGCRTQVILQYLGEKVQKRCGRCDNDLRSAAEARAAAREAQELEDVLERIGKEIEAEGSGEDLPKAKRTRTRMVSLDEAPAPAATAAEVESEPEEEDDDGEVEAIEQTAAELAAEESDGDDAEITVLKRKKRPKPPREPKKAEATAGEQKKRRRKRRRRKKGRPAVAPPAAFTSPVLVITPPPAVGAPTAAPGAGGASTAEAGGRAPAGAEPPPPPRPAPVTATVAGVASAPTRGTGPIVEYVRRPMKIASQPVASASPHDTGRRGHDRRRHGGGRHGQGGHGQGGRGHGGRGHGQPRQQHGATGQPQGRPGFNPPPQVAAGGAAAPGQPGQPGLPGQGKRKRRRKRRRGGGAGQPQPATPGAVSPLASFWQSVGPNPNPNPNPNAGAPGAAAAHPGQPQPGQPSPPGEGRRRRRRRRRRRGGQGFPPQAGVPQGGAPASPPSNGPTSSNGAAAASENGSDSTPPAPSPSSPEPSSGGER